MVLRGNIVARIDAKGRLKVPNAFRSAIAEEHGDALYVTSITGQSVLIYPMPVWEGIEDALRKAPSRPSRRKFVDRVNYFGQQAEFDGQGRVLIHGRLRESAEMVGLVDVVGNWDFLEVWNDERYRTKLANDPITDEDLSELAEYGI